MDNISTINGQTFRNLLLSGYKALEDSYELINELNVFPVPDGDTGTNMKITYYNGLMAIGNSEDLSEVANSFATGLLYGARGNSGVLMSQYFRGLASKLNGHQEVNVYEFAEGLKEGYRYAYKSTINPTEGTILTVAREGVENIDKKINDQMVVLDYIKLLCDSMKESLDNTPNLLPILKESGVIDSGGKGLLTIFDGFRKYLNGESVSMSIEPHAEVATNNVDFSAFDENSEMTYGYCTEFILQLLNAKTDIPSFDLDEFIECLKTYGESIVATMDKSAIKVHIHTQKPGKVLEFALTYGEFLTVKIENMSIQHDTIVKNKKKGLMSVISIANGDGIIHALKEMGSNIVINGGQTMNTSTDEIIHAFKKANSEYIILLPNNSNIILAAKQALELYSDSKIMIVPTTTIQEGYFTLMMSMGDRNDPEALYEEMMDNYQLIMSCYVAEASKDTCINGVDVFRGHYFINIDGKIVACKEERIDALMQLFENIEDIDDKEVAFVIYGNQVDKDELSQVQDLLSEKYPCLEISFVRGEQDFYDYLIGVNR